MARPKSREKRQQVTTHLLPAALVAIDGLRGLYTSRSSWIAQAVDAALANYAAEVEPTGRKGPRP